jgi:hypothetical protein
MNENNEIQEVEEYGDPGIESHNAQVPIFLKWTYLLLPIWGIIAFYLYWNGSSGWLDRGYWRQLQNAAKTTFPIINFDSPPNQE